MSPIARGFLALAVCVDLAFGLAAWSVVVHRPVTMVVGNMCQSTVDNPAGYCFAPLPAGGWPFAFLYDSPGTSVRGQLGFEDDFRPGWFVLDMAVFGAVPAAGAVVGAVVLRRRRRRSPQSLPF